LEILVQSFLHERINDTDFGAIVNVFLAKPAASVVVELICPVIEL